jgi:hypothetical protein
MALQYPTGHQTPISHCSSISSLPFPQEGRADKEESTDGEDDKKPAWTLCALLLLNGGMKH